MEFLVRFEIGFPHDFPADEREKLQTAERAHGRQLWDSGVMKRIWRVPGRWAAIVIYEVPGPTELHEMLAALPLYPFMDITVEPLAKHPFEASLPAAEQGKETSL